MISFIKGHVISLHQEKVVVLTSGGVGYGLIINTNTAQGLVLNQEVTLHAYLSVRENGMDLYGFLSEAERDLFLKLLSVNGVGPKSALNILSLGTPQEIMSAIANKDADFLAGASGIGKKAAERIVVDLANKLSEMAVLGNPSVTGAGNVIQDVVSGLVSLGYSRQEALNAVKDLDKDGKSSEELLKEALQRI